MDILILVFSPSGNTLKISNALEEKLASTGNSVQLLDLTRNKEVFKDGNVDSFFKKNIRKHDVICIGSPVYEKHIESYVKAIFKALPAPDGTWGTYAVPFFTYGGISSGIALKEANALLTASGRLTIACMKIESSHLRTAKIQTRVNEGMPGDEAIPYIADLVGRINAIGDKTVAIAAKELDYQGAKEKIVSAIMKEEILHKHVYGALTVIKDLCVSCSKCIAICPIQRIESKHGKSTMDNTSPECIHCFSCVNACPQSAITYGNGDKGWAKIERIFSKVSKDGSVFKSEEMPRSAVYPIVK